MKKATLIWQLALIFWLLSATNSSAAEPSWELPQFYSDRASRIEYFRKEIEKGSPLLRPTPEFRIYTLEEKDKWPYYHYRVSPSAARHAAGLSWYFLKYANSAALVGGKEPIDPVAYILKATVYATWLILVEGLNREDYLTHGTTGLPRCTQRSCARGWATVDEHPVNTLNHPKEEREKNNVSAWTMQGWQTSEALNGIADYTTALGAFLNIWPEYLDKTLIEIAEERAAACSNSLCTIVYESDPLTNGIRAQLDAFKDKQFYTTTNFSFRPSLAKLSAKEFFRHLLNYQQGILTYWENRLVANTFAHGTTVYYFNYADSDLFGSTQATNYSDYFNVFNVSNLMGVAAFKYGALTSKRSDHSIESSKWRSRAHLIAKEWRYHWRTCKGRNGNPFPNWAYEDFHGSHDKIADYNKGTAAGIYKGDDRNHATNTMSWLSVATGLSPWDKAVWPEFHNYNDWRSTDFQWLGGALIQWWTQPAELWKNVYDKDKEAWFWKPWLSDYRGLIDHWAFDKSWNCYDQDSTLRLKSNASTTPEWENPPEGDFFTTPHTAHYLNYPYAFIENTYVQDEIANLHYGHLALNDAGLDSLGKLLYVYDGSKPSWSAPDITIGVLRTAQEESVELLLRVVLGLIRLIIEATENTVEDLRAAVQAAAEFVEEVIDSVGDSVSDNCTLVNGGCGDGCSGGGASCTGSCSADGAACSTVPYRGMAGFLLRGVLLLLPLLVWGGWGASLSGRRRDENGGER